MTLRELTYEYAKLRESAYALRDERARAAYAAIPRLKEIDDERRQAAFLLGEKLIRALDPEQERKAVNKIVASLNAEEAALLEMNGLSADYLKPHFHCELCSDTGYVGSREKTMCACMKRQLETSRFERSFIHPDERFETFRTDIFPDESQKKLTLSAKKICESYADMFPSNAPRSLLLMGNSGLGKSFLLNCISNRVQERGHNVYKITAYNLIETVMQSIRLGSGTPDFLMPELLVIDDLGTEQMIKNITSETLFSIVNERQSASKATLIATNLSREKLIDFYGERLYSRLIAPRQSAVLTLKGVNLHIALKP
ncbi:MAG TPA: ATP-binding protein [Clostridia bacterium]|nr:ATP-binding protein [Clostridia bacterium]